MKLLNLTLRWSLMIALGGSFISIFLYYFMVQSFLKEELEERLNYQKQVILDHRNTTGSFPVFLSGAGELMELDSGFIGEPLTGFRDTLFYDSGEKEVMEYHVLSFVAKGQGRPVLVKVGKSYVEEDDTLLALTGAMSLLVILLVGAFVLSNYYFSKTVWKPFNESLSRIRQFEFGSRMDFLPPPTRISEFRELNSVLEDMIRRSKNAFQNLKEFTENASHEIQTPLTIILSNLEAGFQSENLKSEDKAILRNIYENVMRLSKMNQSLILLTKIENHQFGGKEEVDFRNLIQSKLAHFQELGTARNLEFSVVSDSPCLKSINPELADILLNNLLGNAVRHAVSGTAIRIQIFRNGFSISNQTILPEGSEKGLGNRFHKPAGSFDKGLGLGLAICKRIADFNQLEISFQVNKGIFNVSLTW